MMSTLAEIHTALVSLVDGVSGLDPSPAGMEDDDIPATGGWFVCRVTSLPDFSRTDGTGKCIAVIGYEVVIRAALVPDPNTRIGEALALYHATLHAFRTDLPSVVSRIEATEPAAPEYRDGAIYMFVPLNVHALLTQ